MNFFRAIQVKKNFTLNAMLGPRGMLRLERLDLSKLKAIIFFKDRALAFTINGPEEF